MRGALGTAAHTRVAQDAHAPRQLRIWLRASSLRGGHSPAACPVPTSAACNRMHQLRSTTSSTFRQRRSLVGGVLILAPHSATMLTWTGTPSHVSIEASRLSPLARDSSPSPTVSTRSQFSWPRPRTVGATMPASGGSTAVGRRSPLQAHAAGEDDPTPRFTLDPAITHPPLE
jgi:hypothetical protein